MSSQGRTRIGMGRGAKPPGLRGIDLFNAARQKHMAKKKESGEVAIHPKAIELPKVQLPSMTGSTVCKPTLPPASGLGIDTTACIAPNLIQRRLSDICKQVINRARKETPEEYRARHAKRILAAAEMARLREEKKLQRERAKKLRAVTREFYRHCRQDNLCLNCGWPGHIKKQCPDPPYAPVWSEDGELSFEPANATKDTPTENALTLDSDYDKDAKVIESADEK